MSADEREVTKANEAFYAAFRARDVEAMESLWAQRSPVGCVHPGWAPLRGRDVVMRSWRAIFHGEPPNVSVSDVRVSFVAGVACVVCLEQLTDAEGQPGGVFVATNLYVQEDRAWRIVHHHSGPIAAVEEDDDDDEATDADGRLLN